MKRTNKYLTILIVAFLLICIAGCASTSKVYEGTGDFMYESSYEKAGYKFVYKAYDGYLTFNYIDIYSDAEIDEIGNVISDLYPSVASFSETAPGQLTFVVTETPTAEAFDNLVSGCNSFIDSKF